MHRTKQAAIEPSSAGEETMKCRMERVHLSGGERHDAGGKSLLFGHGIRMSVCLLIFVAGSLSAEGGNLPDVQACVESRYEDSRWLEYIHSCNTAEGFEQLRQVCRLIAQRYYPMPDADAVLERGLKQLEAATRSPRLGNLSNPLDVKYLAMLREQTGQIRREIVCRDERLKTADLEQEAFRIAAQLEPIAVKAGLGASWAAMEFSGALASSLDPYSHVFSPSQYQTLQDRMKGGYAGIGVDLVLVNGRPMIYDVFSDGPAGRAGMRPGSVIVQMNKQDTLGLSFSRIQELMCGAARSRISLTVQNDGRRADYTVLREPVGGVSVRYIRKLPGTETGFMRISNFDGDTAMELRRGINELERFSVTSLILDLRDNGGGIMASAIDAAKLFLSEGLIAVVQSRAEEVEYRSEAHGMEVCVLPLVILVNEQTASAAEIFAAALQDHQRAIVLGRSTMGKTQIQTLYPLGGRTAFSLTTGRYRRPDEKRRNSRVVEPDVRVERDSKAVYTMDYYLSERDRELNRALQILPSAQKSFFVGVF